MSRIAAISLLGVSLSLTVLAEAVAQSTSPNPYATPAGVIPSPYWGYTDNPYASAQQDVTDIIRGNSPLLGPVQQAALLREQALAAKLKTRTETLKQWAWEGDLKPEIGAKERQQIRTQQKEGNRQDPPNAEIFDASALNALLKELMAQPLPVAGSIPLDPVILAHICAASPVGGNPGLLRNNRIPWPQVLRSSELSGEREGIERLLDQARKYPGSAAGGEMPVEDFLRFRQLLGNLRNRVDRAARGSTWSPSDSIRVDRFLGELQQTVQLLRQPETAICLRPLQGKTVAELIAFMKSEGLTAVAGATVGTERYYLAFHRALADELKRVRPSGR